MTRDGTNSGCDDVHHSSPSPAAAQPRAAAVATPPGRTVPPPATQEFHGWDDESEPELDDDTYERYAFDPDQPASERRDERGASGALPALERPASLPVQRGERPAPSAPPADPTAVPAAGMPSAGASAAHSAAGTPSGSAGRRDSQLTDKGYFDVKYYHNRLW